VQAARLAIAERAEDYGLLLVRTSAVRAFKRYVRRNATQVRRTSREGMPTLETFSTLWRYLPASQPAVRDGVPVK